MKIVCKLLNVRSPQDRNSVKLLLGFFFKEPRMLSTVMVGQAAEFAELPTSIVGTSINPSILL